MDLKLIIVMLSFIVLNLAYQIISSVLELIYFVIIFFLILIMGIISDIIMKKEV